MDDISFEHFNSEFERNIYQKPKGRLREEVLWRDMCENLPLKTGVPLSILDCGGGDGRTALRCARLGHNIVLNDLSESMMNSARQRFRENDLSDCLTCVPGPFQVLLPAMKNRFDLVLCHAVLEWLAKPEEAIAYLKAMLKPGGWLSLMFYNQQALVFHKVVKTHYFQIHHPSPMKRKSRFTPPNPLVPADVFQWMTVQDMAPRSTAGIRVFFDYIEHADKFKELTPDLLELELHYKNLFPYVHLGRYIHVTARKAP